MLTTRVDPRIMMIIGFGAQSYAGFGMMQFDLNVDQTLLATNSIIQGMGIGLTWVPMTVVTFATLAPEYRAEGMSMFHLLRNFGSSLFISIAVAEIVRTTSANYARLTEQVSPFNEVWNMPWATGNWHTTVPAGATAAQGVKRPCVTPSWSRARGPVR
jgi:DHA2 family multidrug resistance protein